MEVKEISYDYKSNQYSFPFEFDIKIAEDWNDGYELEVDLEAKYDLEAWEVNFYLPYKITETYGVDIIDQGDGNYTISGQNDQVNLDQGDSINPTFIVEDNGQLSLVPKYISSDAKIINKEEEKDKIEQKIIDVDKDFSGDLESAIAAAEDGDLVQLGDNIYYTTGIIIDKNITIDGQSDAVINGDGTSESILFLTEDASGATIQNVEITNGNNGILVHGAANLTLQNLDINHIGINETIRENTNNIGIELDHAEGFKLFDSHIHNIGRKAVGIVDTDGGTISGLTVENVNLEAEHAQSHDAAGIKLFNTNDITVSDNHLSDINAIYIWNDISNATTIENNVLENVGEDFLAPAFNNYVDIFGIYNEKSSNSTVKNNEGNAIEEFLAFKSTEFSDNTMTYEDNNFSSYELGTTDYWVNELAEKVVALTEDPDEANFSLFANEYIAQANIGN